MDDRPSAESVEPCSPLWVATLVGAPAVFVALAFVLPLLPPGEPSFVCPPDPAWPLRRIAVLCRLHDPSLAHDGRLDVYGMLRREHDPDAIVDACGGPSREEIAAGDYTNFPYQRRRGSFSPDAVPPLPILWERSGAYRRVAFSDGSMRMLTDAEVADLFRNDPGQE